MILSQLSNHPAVVAHYIGSGARYGLICCFPGLAWAEVATFFVRRCSIAVIEDDVAKHPLTRWILTIPDLQRRERWQCFRSVWFSFRRNIPLSFANNRTCTHTFLRIAAFQLDVQVRSIHYIKQTLFLFTSNLNISHHSSPSFAAPASSIGGSQGTVHPLTHSTYF